MRGRIALWVAVWGLSLALAGQARADGVAFGGEALSPLDWLPQHQQMAAIAHRNGIEKLIIAINIDMADDEEALWIFPVPGTPDRIRLDVLDTFPEFSGEDVRAQAGSAIYDSTALMTVTQIYPLVLALPLIVRAGGPSGFGSVSVHQEVDKYGVHAEAIRTHSLDALSEYLEGRGAHIARAHLQAFEPYLSDEYVLVLAWIASREELLRQFPHLRDGWMEPSHRWPCLYVEFPTERAFYPLRPTSAYGQKWILISLFVLGFVRLDVDDPKWAEEHFGVAYCKQEGFGPNAPEVFTDGLAEGSVAYTVVYDRSLTADQLTSDLWFTPHEPASVAYACVIAVLLSPYILVPLCALLVAALSYVSAGVSAGLVYGKWNPYSRLGVWNVLTLIGLGYAVAKYRKREVGGKLDLVPFLLAFTVIYTALVFAVRAALLAPLG